MIHDKTKNLIFFFLLFLSSFYLPAQNLEILFSHQRGFYTTSFSMSLSSDPGTTIKYTIDGSHPMSNGTIYSAPLNITTTTAVRAVSYNLTDTSKVRSQTYIYTANVVNQPSNILGFPVSTGISSTVTENGTWGPQMEAALQSIPTTCLVMDLTDYNTIWNAKGIERPANFEYFDNDGNSYGEPSGVNTYGNSSFNSTNKKNYRFKFKEEYGANSFDEPIFGPEATDKFDVIDLRCGSQETMIRGGVQNIHENMFKDLQIALSGSGPHTFFAHLYINGVYWGVYSGSERPNKSFGESYFGGDKDDYNTMKATCCNSTPLPIDGTNGSYFDLYNQVNNYATIEQYLDVDHFMDYVLLCNYGPHGDWRTWNTYAIENPVEGIPYRFFMWDVEPSMFNDWYHTNKKVNTRDHESIWQPLKANQEFQIRYGDNVECKCMEEDGALFPPGVEQRYIDLFDENKLAYLMEAARWKNLTLYNEFLTYRDYLISSGWFQNRLDEVIAAYKTNNIYPTTESVEFSMNGGLVASGTTINLTNGNSGGIIYSTVDGSDPRLSGGGVNPTASTGNSITINQTLESSSRVLFNGEWSAMCPKVFYTPQNYSDLIINEIHYNQDTFHCGNGVLEMEFIELYNKGNTTINLTNCTFTAGIDFTFPLDATIDPGAYLVLAEDASALAAAFGISVYDEYKGKLSNSGELLVLNDPFGNVIDQVEYNDAEPWDQTPDDGGPSLELIDPSLDNDDPLNWLHSRDFCGTPAASNSSICSTLPSEVVINEINYNSGSSDPGDWIELHNTTMFTVDLSNWEIRDEGGIFIIPTGTMILPDKYLVIANDISQFKSVFPTVNNSIGDLGFGLSSKGERLTLHTASSCLVDHVAFEEDPPWPTPPDGTGPTLSLVIPNTDNLTHTNWEASTNLPAPIGTPGRSNEPCPALTIVEPMEICAKIPTSFSVENPTPGALYIWTFPGGIPTTAFGANVTVTWNSPTSSNVQLSTGYFECQSSETLTVSIVSCNSANAVDDFYTIDEDDTLANDVSSNESDPEGDNVNYMVTSNVSNGILSFNTDGTFSYTPSSNYFGTDSFSYEVCDDGVPVECAFANVFITINSVNDSPEAIDDSIMTQEDNPVAGNLLVNDSDPVESDNLVLTQTSITLPANGMVVFSANGDFTYTPNLNFYGDDQLTYEICDDGNPVECDMAQLTVTVNPINDPPILNDDSESTLEDTPITISILSNDNDVDGNLDLTTLQIINSPLASEGVIIINGNSTVTFTPALNYHGTVTPIVYEICDDGNPVECDMAQLTVTVNPINDPPILNDDSEPTLEDTPITISILSNDNDVDGNLDLATLQIINSPLASEGVIIINGNSTVTFTPALNYHGTVTPIVYEICDDGNPVECDMAQLTVTVYPINDPPILNDDSESTLEDTPITIPILSNDNDVDGDLDLTTLQIINSPLASEGVIIINGNSTVTFTPALNYHGTVTPIVYEICDDGTPLPVICETATIQIEVVSVNETPVANVDMYSIQEDQMVSDNVLTNDTDPDGDSLFVTTLPIIPPTNGIVTLSIDGSYTYQPSTGFFGTDTFEYEICDNGVPVLCDHGVVIISITACPDAIIAGPTSVCATQSITFEATDQGTGAIYLWDFGTGATPQQSNNRLESVIFSTPGYNQIRLSVLQNGCSDTVQVNLEIKPEIFAEAGADATICLYSSKAIGGNPSGPSGASYQWSPSSGLNSDFVANPSAFPTETTTYTVVVTQGNCSISDQVTLTVDTQSASFADAGEDKVFCGSSVEIGGAPSGPNGATFSWNPINGLDNPNTANPNASPTTPTTYTLTVSQNGCSKTDIVYVDKTSPPNMSAGIDQTICLNPSGQGVVLGGSNNFPSNIYQWAPINGLSNPTEGNTFANPGETTIYSLTATRNGCSVEDEVMVVVDICNEYPIAIDDNEEMGMDSMINFNVLNNDSDPDGDNLSLTLIPILDPQNGNVNLTANGGVSYSPNQGFIGLDSLIYEVCDDGIPVFCSQAIILIEVVEPPCTSINLKVLLEGPYDLATNKMKTTLNSDRRILPGQIPVNPLTVPTPAGQPFDMSPWNYTGSEGLDFSDLSYIPEVVDWVLVSFRTNPAKNTELARTAALLLEDGTVELVNPCPLADSITSDLYIVIEHRSHIGVMTPLPISIVDRKIGYDFTIQDSYKDSGYGQKFLPADKWVMFSGDASQTNDVGGYDINGSDKILWNIENGNFNSYFPSDFNMDGDVSGSDKVLHSGNNGVYSKVPK